MSALVDLCNRWHRQAEDSHQAALCHFIVTEAFHPGCYHHPDCAMGDCMDECTTSEAKRQRGE